MPKRHIRERKLKLFEETGKIENATQGGMQAAIDQDLARFEKTEQILRMHGMPSDLPGLANVIPETLNATIGTITKSGGMLNMNNPAIQGLGALGLAYAIKPELVRGFLGSSVGSGIVGGAGAYILGSSTGEMLGDSGMLSTGVGAGIGYALGVTLGVPGLGLVFGGLFGGQKKRRAKSRARTEIREAISGLVLRQQEAKSSLGVLQEQQERQNAALEQFLNYTDSAQQSLLLGKKSIDLQRTRLIEQRDINVGIAAKNEKEIRRVANLRNDSIRRETEKVLGRQKVQMAMSVTSFAGSFWYIDGETIDMGLKAQQEVNLKMKSDLEAQAIEYGEMMKNYQDLSTQLDYAAYGVEKEGSLLASEAGTRAKNFGSNLRVLDAQTKTIGQNIDMMDRKIRGMVGKHNNLGGDMKFAPVNNDFKWDTTKEQKMLERAKRRAEALTVMSFGEAITSTKAGTNPFDALINYGMFS